MLKSAISFQFLPSSIYKLLRIVNKYTSTQYDII